MQVYHIVTDGTKENTVVLNDSGRDIAAGRIRAVRDAGEHGFLLELGPSLAVIEAASASAEQEAEECAADAEAMAHAVTIHIHVGAAA